MMSRLVELRLYGRATLDALHIVMRMHVGQAGGWALLEDDF
jgi:hypothetical protein